MRLTLSFLLVLALFAGGMPMVAPTVCTDGCEEESGDGCFDCACCAPTRAPALLGVSTTPVAVAASRHEAEPTPRTAHVDPGDIFHVPRLAA